jgi:hypothetical protein
MSTKHRISLGYTCKRFTFGNVSGTTKDRRRKTSWIQFWKDETSWKSSRNPKCSVKGCSKEGYCGGHIAIDGCVGRMFIVPLCYHHNHPTYNGTNTMKSRIIKVVEIIPFIRS